MKKLIMILILALLAVFILRSSAKASSPDTAKAENITPEVKVEKTYVFPEREQLNPIRIGIH